METIFIKEKSKDIQWRISNKDVQEQGAKNLKPFYGEFKTIWIKFGKSITKLFARVMMIVNEMHIYGDRTKETNVVKKILRSLGPKFNFIVCAIKESNDTNTITLDKLPTLLLVLKQKVKQLEVVEKVLKTSNNTHSNNFRWGGRGRGRGRLGARDLNNSFKSHNDQEEVWRSITNQK